MGSDHSVGPSEGSRVDGDPDAEGHRLLWPEYGTLQQSPVYLPRDLSRKLAWWEFKPWRTTLWPKDRRPLGLGILQLPPKTTIKFSDMFCTFAFPRIQLLRPRLHPCDRRFTSIVAEKSKGIEQHYRMLWGSQMPIPTIVHGQDGERQFEKWDQYVLEIDKPYLRTPHCDTTYLIALLTSTICHQAYATFQTSASRERKYVAACLLRDLVNSALTMGDHNLCGLPVGTYILPLEGCKVYEAKEFLVTQPEGVNLVSWWNAILARDIVLPGDTSFLTNPVARLVTRLHWCFLIQC